MLPPGLVKIQSILKSLPLKGLEALKQLFWEELNYEPENLIVSIRDWPDPVKHLLVDSPIIFASSGEGLAFHVIICQLQNPKISLVSERQLVNQLIKEYPYALYIFSNALQNHWHFVNVIYQENITIQRRRIIRRISISSEDRLRTASERIEKLNIQSIQEGLFLSTPQQIQRAHEEAFDVEAVTKEFFEEYKCIFINFQAELKKLTNDSIWAHDFALQFLNRLMFLYYIQRKCWLGNDADFLHNFWRAYHQNNRPKDTFVDEWLNILFFEAFNHQFQAGRSDRVYLPESIRNALQLAPYLNGGLFRKNDLDQKECHISDQQIDKIFKFLDRYNFTISEYTPLDQEVAVDPEMIGKVYESLVNVSAEAHEQAEAGIFYTPRIEIDLMCRLSLVDWLTNHLGVEHKSTLYNVIFAYDPEDKVDADQELSILGLWPKFAQLLNQATVLDPACGSGSFLVGMLLILDDLLARSEHYLVASETSYERRKRIIGNCLYGVDVMGWAVHVAELRLWLQLVIETEIDPYELIHTPLLPNLSFKIRRGDSLVQDVGGISLGLQRSATHLTSVFKTRIHVFKNEKLKFFNNDPTCRYQNDSQIRQDEFLLFKEILEENVSSLKKRIVELQQTLAPQRNLLGEITNPQMTLEMARKTQELEDSRIQISQLFSALSALQNNREIPFVWDIAFVEIFEGDNSGFDIVIGNPPYVRQENIRDPNLQPDQVTPENKKAYKEKLSRSVYTNWPKTLGWNTETGKASWQLDGKSDYYIYFYFDCLKLLNPSGSFCFITSNSWLDVGYGKDLQWFLLTRSKIKLIIDNQVKRSFSSADINTIIILLSSVEDSKQNIPSSFKFTARFVILKVPFEVCFSPIIWEEVETVSDCLSTPEYRCRAIMQSELFDSGVDQELGVYIGNKWGGIYLRGHDIYFIIAEKSKGLEVKLSEYFKGERYLNTGGADGFFILTDVSTYDENSFFVRNSFLNANKFEGIIEKKFLMPLVKDLTKHDSRIEIHTYDAYCLVVKETPSENLLKYIRWGEKQGFDKRSVTKNQHPWFKPTNQMLKGANIIVPRSFNDKYVIHSNPHEFLSLRFYRLHLRKGKLENIVAFLNSTLMIFYLETLGNKSLGLGVLDFFMEDFLKLKVPVIDNDIFRPYFETMKERQILDIWGEFGIDENEKTKSDRSIMQNDRMEIDNFIFDAIRLTTSEREAVYEAIAEMVRNRLQKADST